MAALHSRPINCLASLHDRVKHSKARSRGWSTRALLLKRIGVASFHGTRQQWQRWLRGRQKLTALSFCWLMKFETSKQHSPRTTGRSRSESRVTYCRWISTAASSLTAKSNTLRSSRRAHSTLKKTACEHKNGERLECVAK